jgi:hypothetical protein
MTDAYFYPRFAEQEGWTQAATPQTFKVEYFGGIGVEAGRDLITRFFDVDLPAGATITAAYVIYYIYAKDEATAQNFTYNYYYEATATGGTTIRQDATPLRIGIAEDSTSNRTWGAAVNGGSPATFNWNTSGGDDQPFQVNVTSIVQQAFNNSGRHMNLAFKLSLVSETGDMGIGTAGNNQKQRLLIQYTGGTARNEVVNVYENNNFAQTFFGAPSNWFNNPIFGTFQSNPTYTTQSSFSGIPAAPNGGNIFQVQASADGRAVSFHRAPNDLQWGQWYCFSVYVYVPTGVSDVKISSFQSLYGDNGRVTVKDTWTRVYVPYLIGPDDNPVLGVGSVDSMTTGQSFYIANMNFTKGNNLYPYFDGSTTDDATHHRTFDWGGGTTGTRNGGISYATLDNAPTVTGVSPQPTMSTYRQIVSYWNYSDPYSEPESRFRVEIRKKRRP